MDEFFTEFPPVVKHPYTSKMYSDIKPIDWQAADDSLQVDRSVNEVSWATPGTVFLFLNHLKIIRKWNYVLNRLHRRNSAIRIIY